VRLGDRAAHLPEPVFAAIRRAVAEELGVAVGPIGLVAAGGAQDVERQAAAPRLPRAVSRRNARRHRDLFLGSPGSRAG